MNARIEFYVEPDSYLDTHFGIYDPNDEVPDDIYIDLEVEGSIIDSDVDEESVVTGMVDCELIEVIAEINGRLVDIIPYLSHQEVERIRGELVEAYYEDYRRAS